MLLLCEYTTGTNCANASMTEINAFMVQSQKIKRKGMERSGKKWRLFDDDITREIVCVGYSYLFVSASGQPGVTQCVQQMEA